MQMPQFSGMAPLAPQHSAPATMHQLATAQQPAGQGSQPQSPIHTVGRSQSGASGRGRPHMEIPKQLQSQIKSHVAASHKGHHRNRSDQSSGSGNWHQSLLNAENSAKPAPRRHYIWESTNIAKHTEKLAVDQLEAARRAALHQPHDPQVQLDYAKKLVEASTQLANRYTDPFTPSTILVDSKVEAKNREIWISQALKITKKLVSRATLPDATFFLACNYSSGGMGLEIDNVKAFELYFKAAKQDLPEACYRVAVCFELGVGVKSDAERALSWYLKAASLGDVPSMYKLGMTYLKGDLRQRVNFSEALMWLQRAADKADKNTPHAVHELGLLFEHARDLPPDAGIVHNDQAALDLFAKAANLGYPPSQYRLGHAFEFGELGLPVDPPRSIDWYNVAAQNGDSDAELALAGWHWTGAENLLKPNDTEAFHWAEKSAKKGNAKAEFALGYFYQFGVGVPIDLEKAKMFYLRAYEKKHPRALNRLRELGAS